MSKEKLRRAMGIDQDEDTPAAVPAAPGTAAGDVPASASTAAFQITAAQRREEMIRKQNARAEKMERKQEAREKRQEAKIAEQESAAKPYGKSRFTMNNVHERCLHIGVPIPKTPVTFTLDIRGEVKDEIKNGGDLCAPTRRELMAEVKCVAFRDTASFHSPALIAHFSHLLHSKCTSQRWRQSQPCCFNAFDISRREAYSGV